jgi:hypothetical protein
MRDVPNGIEVSGVEHQKELIVIIETLDSMGRSLREVPDIANAELVDLITAIFVNGRHQHTASIDISPLSLQWVSNYSS